MDINVISVYGKNLTYVRETLSLSKRKLSKVAGVKYQTIQQLESGKQRSSGVETGLKLADALCINLETLVRGNIQK
jgi:DNA-binding XRE family transcriptional regulator